MCLYIKKEDLKVKVATEDIKCYKLMLHSAETNFYYSMYQGFGYRVGCPYKENFDAAIKYPVERFHIVNEMGEHCLYQHLENLKFLYGQDVNYDEGYSFGSGGFHSFKETEKEDFEGCNYYVIECVIPKGSRYIEGIDLTENKGAYFSEEILIIGEIKFA